MALLAKQVQAPLSLRDRIIFLWCIMDALTHFSLEAAYCVLTWRGGAKHHSGLAARVWQLYSRADTRWEGVATDVLAIEIATVLVTGTLAVAVAWGVWQRKPWRHALTLVLCICELYGGWMTFAPPILDSVLQTVAPQVLMGAPWGTWGDMMLWWIFLVYCNGLWVLVPGVLAWDSIRVLSYAADLAKVESEPVAMSRAPARWFWLCALAVMAYGIVVPGAVLLGPAVLESGL